MFIRERVQLVLFELPLNFGSFLLIDLGVGHVGQRGVSVAGGTSSGS